MSFLTITNYEKYNDDMMISNRNAFRITLFFRKWTYTSLKKRFIYFFGTK